jgi:hypothetical protein
VIVSTLKGAEYITTVNTDIMKKIIDILQDEEDGSVNQRFCVAILQKISIKEDTVIHMVKLGIIDWIMDLVKRSLKREVHVFSLDFSSALLANILHAKETNEYLDQNKHIVSKLLITMISLIREKVPTSVLMHLLICLSYMSKE